MTVRWPLNEQQLLDAVSRVGKLTPAAKNIAKLLPQLTRDQLEEFKHWATIEDLASATPELRHELLSKMDTCPCCDRWLGHNRPPADDGDPPYRRQMSLFERAKT